MIPFRGKDAEDQTLYDKLGSPFAYRDAYNSEDVDAFDAAGALHLSHHGCAWYSMLIVSGPCRSQVWTDDVASDGGFSPEVAPETGARLTFTSWYMAWLDRAFQELGAP